MNKSKKSIFPKSVAPPKLVKNYGIQLGWIAAAISASFAVLHLFRIDTLIPIMNRALPGGDGVATTFVVIVILAEVFALPFLLRMKLSPLAHFKSGFLAVLAPLLWLLVTVWGLGLDYSTGQFGQFITTVSSWPIVLANFAWLALSFFTLWTLGYNNLKIKDLLKK